MSIFIYVHFVLFGQNPVQQLVPFFQRFIYLHTLPTSILEFLVKIPTPCSKTENKALGLEAFQILASRK